MVVMGKLYRGDSNRPCHLVHTVRWVLQEVLEERWACMRADIGKQMPPGVESLCPMWDVL